MLSMQQNVKATLFTGPAALSKTFMFEAAIHLAEEGRPVVYITPAPLERLPSGCHDRSNPALAAFKLMRFMYLKNYQALLEQLVDLHNYGLPPSGLLIDDLDNYLNDIPAYEDEKIHIGRICALVLDATHACSRILNSRVDVCVWSSSVLVKTGLHFLYFRSVWKVSEDVDAKEILLEKVGNGSLGLLSFKYQKLEDGTRVLKEMLSSSPD